MNILIAFVTANAAGIFATVLILFLLFVVVRFTMNAGKANLAYDSLSQENTRLSEEKADLQATVQRLKEANKAANADIRRLSGEPGTAEVAQSDATSQVLTNPEPELRTPEPHQATSANAPNTDAPKALDDTTRADRLARLIGR